MDDSEKQDGKRPEGVEVELYANGNPTGKKVTLDKANQWTYTWEDLEEKANGRKITYSVKETGETNGEVTFDGAKYTVAYADDQNGHITVTNTHIPSTVDIEGSKTWDDQGNEGARPEKITIHLKADGVEKDSKEVTAEAGWKWKFANLEEYSAGTKITYTVVEDTVENYVTSKGDGAYDIKNTYDPGKTSITINKVWDDSETRMERDRKG
ncbi:MAG: Cna B-type domain-containing protein [Blautia sp.]